MKLAENIACVGQRRNECKITAEKLNGKYYFGDLLVDEILYYY
jgi:hypothetical protein